MLLGMEGKGFRDTVVNIVNVVQHPGGGNSHMKLTGMLVGKLELNPIWAWLRHYLTPKGDHAKTDNQIRATVILIALKTAAKD